MKWVFSFLLYKHDKLVKPWATLEQNNTHIQITIHRCLNGVGTNLSVAMFYLCQCYREVRSHCEFKWLSKSPWLKQMISLILIQCKNMELAIIKHCYFNDLTSEWLIVFLFFIAANDLTAISPTSTKKSTHQLQNKNNEQ